MRGKCGREVSSDLKAHQIHSAAPAPKNRGPVASGSAKGNRREADPERETGLGPGQISDFLSANRRRNRGSQNGKRCPDSVKARAFLRG